MVPKDKSSGSGDGVGMVEGVRKMVMLTMAVVMEVQGMKAVAREVVVKMAVVLMAIAAMTTSIAAVTMAKVDVEMVVVTAGERSSGGELDSDTPLASCLLTLTDQAVFLGTASLFRPLVLCLISSKRGVHSMCLGWGKSKKQRKQHVSPSSGQGDSG